MVLLVMSRRLNANTIGEPKLETIKLISPIDSSVYAERPVITDKALAKVLATSKASQAKWALNTFERRGKLCLEPRITRCKGFAD